MFYLDMSDPETFWLSVTNIGLGIVTFICFLVVVCGLAYQFVPRLKKRLAGHGAIDDHAFDVPGLGLTMADGGEKTPRSDED